MKKINSSTRIKSDEIPDIENITRLYSQFTGKSPDNVQMLTSAGSPRLYFRVGHQPTLIGTIGNDVRENESFFHISSQLREHNVSIPMVIAISTDRKTYLQEDLGDTSLYSIISKDHFIESTYQLCNNALSELIHFQLTGLKYVDQQYCFPVPAMDDRSIRWDLNYFKYCFLKCMVDNIDEPRLEDEFDTLTEYITNLQPRVLIHRDFQSRNIMVSDNKTWFIDFQGARIGPAIYDAVSFLWQSRANFPCQYKKDLLHDYIANLSSKTNIEHNVINDSLYCVISFRMLQVLGAYGFRGLYQGKEQFKSNIPTALSSLSEALDHMIPSLPYLSHLAKEILNRIKKQSY